MKLPKNTQLTKPIKVDNDYDFFREWLKIIRPHSVLGEKEVDFLALILAKRFQLETKILDEDFLIKVLFSKEIKDEIIEELGLKDVQAFENKAHTLRKKGIILENNRIDPRYIPRLEKNTAEVTILFKIIKKDAEG